MRRTLVVASSLLSAVLLLPAACGALPVRAPSSGPLAPGRRPADVTEPAAGVKRRALGSTSARNATAIKYHGGPVLTGPVTVYHVYVGYGKDDRVPAFLDFLTWGIATTKWWKVLTKYYSIDRKTKKRTFVSGKLTWGGSIFVPLSVMKSRFKNNLASDTAVPDVIAWYLNRPDGVPYHKDAVYVLIPNRQKGLKMGTFFCKKACGWHSWQDYYWNSSTTATFRLTYAYVPEQSQCPACTSDMADAVGDRSPTGDANIAAMADTLAHELAEVVTNPDAATGWFGKTIEEENADLCLTYKPLYTTKVNSTTGGKLTVVYNVMVGKPPESYPYVIQKIWRPDINPKTKRQYGCVTGL